MLPRKIFNVLLLGPKSSGKTTLFNYFKHQHKPFDEVFGIETFKELLIHLETKLIKSLLVLCEIAGYYDEDYHTLKDENYDSIKETFNELHQIGLLVSMEELWKKPQIQRAYISRYFMENKEHNQQLMENMDHFLQSHTLWNIFNVDGDEENFVYPIEDVLNFQTQSKDLDKIEQLQFKVELYNNKYIETNLIDIPYVDEPESFIDEYKGDENIFNDINGILFTVPISDFCSFNCKQNKNGLKHCIEYFEKILKIKRFESIPIFVIMTKYDIFAQNIANGYSMSHCFDQELSQSVIYGQQNACKIWDKNEDPADLRIITHIIPNIIRNTSTSYNLFVPMVIVETIEKYASSINLRRDTIYSIWDSNEDEEKRFCACIDEAITHIWKSFSSIYDARSDKIDIEQTPIDLTNKMRVKLYADGFLADLYNLA